MLVTVIFAADVDSQAGAYATGVLAMMTSAAFAVALTAWRGGRTLGTVFFSVITAVFFYALASNVYQRPDGITIALFFIGAIIAISLVSRIQRSTELRQERIDVDEKARGFIEEAATSGEIHLVAHRRRTTSRVRSRSCSWRYRSKMPRSSWTCSRLGASRSGSTGCCVA
jgi:K+ transporter